MKKAITLLISAAILTSNVVMAENSDTAVKIYVCAATGRDSNVKAPLTTDVKLKTVDGALKRLAYIESQAPANDNYEIVFLSGTYTVDKTLTLNNTTLSGVNSLAFKANAGDEVVLSGTKSVSGFTSITDEGIRSRLKYPDKVYQVKLSDCGISTSNIVYVNETMNWTYFNQLFDGGTAQPLAEYPNGANNYAVYEDGVKSEDGSYTYEFTYTDDEISKIQFHSQLFAGGYFGYDYAYLRNRVSAMDTTKKSITLAYSKASSTQSRRFKIFNALELIDSPGEWYADKTAGILYYYPANEAENISVEFSVLNSVMFKMVGAQNISFEGLKFTGTNKGVISATHEAKTDDFRTNPPKASDNCRIINCEFSGNAGYIIEKSGTNVDDFVQRDYSPIVGDKTEALGHDRIGGGKNWVISGNIFTENQGMPIRILSGGNPYTLEDAGDVIENNYFANNCTELPSEAVMNIRAKGVNVIHNVFNNTSGQAIVHNGFNHKIMYNEFNNCLSEVQDAGVIYAGRNIIRRGTEIAYNLIRNYNPNSKNVTPHNRGIYADDEMCGQSIHHNIIVNGDKSITYSGSSGEIYANVSVNTLQGLNLEPYGGNWTASQERKYENWVNGQENAYYADMPKDTYDLWNKTYPAIKAEYDYWKKNGEVEGLFVNVYDNLTVGKNDTIDENYPAKGGKIENNTRVTEFNDFVDAQNGDYRIKSTSGLVSKNSKLLTESNFNINQIGIQDTSVIARAVSDREFSLIYPVGGAVVAADAIEMKWENSKGADCYRIEIGKDKDFTDVVESKTVYENHYTFTPDALNTKYFWRVTAVNNTRSAGGEKMCIKAESFTVNNGDILITKLSDRLEISISDTGANVKISLEKSDGTAEAVEINNGKAYVALPQPTGTKIIIDNGTAGYLYNVDNAAMLDISGYEYSLLGTDKKLLSCTAVSDETSFENLTKEEISSQDNGFTLTDNRLYFTEDFSNYKYSEQDIEAKLHVDEAENMLKSTMLLFRANNIKSKAVTENDKQVNQFYADAYGISLCWGNVQLVKLDSTKTDNTLKAAHSYQNPMVLKCVGHDMKGTADYTLRVKTENLSDGAVKIDVYFLSEGEPEQSILTYVDRDNPYTGSGYTMLHTSTFSVKGIKLKSLKAQSHNSTASPEKLYQYPQSVADISKSKNTVTVVFSDDINEKYIKNITVEDFNKNDVTDNAVMSVQGKTLTIDTTELSGINKLHIPTLDRSYTYKLNCNISVSESFDNGCNFSFLIDSSFEGGTKPNNVPSTWLEPADKTANKFSNETLPLVGEKIKNYYVGVLNQNYKAYSTSKSTLEFKLMAEHPSNAPGDANSAQVLFNLSDVIRPRNAVDNGDKTYYPYQYSQWNLAIKGYGISFCYGNLIFTKYTGNSDKRTDSLQFGEMYNGRTVSFGNGFPSETEYQFKIDSDYADGAVTINVYVSYDKKLEDGSIEKVVKGPYTYVDTDPVSPSGYFGIAHAAAIGDTWYMDDIVFTDRNENVIEDISFTVTDETGAEPDAYSNGVYCLNACDGKTLTFSYPEYITNESSAQVMLALYCNGALVKMSEPKTIQSVSGRLDINTTLEMLSLDKEGKYELKAFIWSDTKNMIPLGGAILAAKGNR